MRKSAVALPFLDAKVPALSAVRDARAEVSVVIMANCIDGQSPGTQHPANLRGEVHKPRMSSALQWDWTEDDLRNVETAVVSRDDQPVNA